MALKAKVHICVIFQLICIKNCIWDTVWCWAWVRHLHWHSFTHTHTLCNWLADALGLQLPAGRMLLCSAEHTLSETKLSFMLQYLTPKVFTVPLLICIHGMLYTCTLLKLHALQNNSTWLWYCIWTHFVTSYIYLLVCLDICV